MFEPPRSSFAVIVIVRVASDGVLELVTKRSERSSPCISAATGKPPEIVKVEPLIRPRMPVVPGANVKPSRPSSKPPVMVTVAR